MLLRVCILCFDEHSSVQFACVYKENSAVDPKYIQQTWHVHLVAFAQMESLNEDCLQLRELTNKELCSNLTAFVCCFAVLVNGWCACKNYKYEHFRNNEEAFMFFGNTRTGTILEPHVCRNLFSCKANVLSNAARVVRKDLCPGSVEHMKAVQSFSVMRGDSSFFCFNTGPVTQHLLCRGLLLTQ